MIILYKMSLPSRYWNQSTVDLADDLLPTILAGKTDEEIIVILDDPANQALVDILRSFCNQTYRVQINVNRGLNVCCYNVMWDNLGGVRLIDPRNMSNLNYLTFSSGAEERSKFIFAVLHVVRVNLRGYLQQTLNSQGLTYCPDNIILDKVC
jgi:hypothetical protein